MPRAGRECAITRHVTNPSSDRFILHNLVWTRWCPWRGACQRKERPRPTRHARDRETTWWRVEILKVKHAAELVWGEVFFFSLDRPGDVTVDVAIPWRLVDARDSTRDA